MRVLAVCTVVLMMGATVASVSAQAMLLLRRDDVAIRLRGSPHMLTTALVCLAALPLFDITWWSISEMESSGLCLANKLYTQMAATVATTLLLYRSSNLTFKLVCLDRSRANLRAWKRAALMVSSGVQGGTATHAQHMSRGDGPRYRVSRPVYAILSTLQSNARSAFTTYGLVSFSFVWIPEGRGTRVLDPKRDLCGLLGPWLAISLCVVAMIPLQRWILNLTARDPKRLSAFKSLGIQAGALGALSVAYFALLLSIKKRITQYHWVLLRTNCASLALLAVSISESVLPLCAVVSDTKSTTALVCQGGVSEARRGSTDSLGFRRPKLEEIILFRPTFELFEQHLYDELALENLSFYLAVTRFELVNMTKRLRVSLTRLRREAYAIYMSFVHPDAPQRVNLSNAVSVPIIEHFSQDSYSSLDLSVSDGLDASVLGVSRNTSGATTHTARFGRETRNPVLSASPRGSSSPKSSISSTRSSTPGGGGGDIMNRSPTTSLHASGVSPRRKRHRHRRRSSEVTMDEFGGRGSVRSTEALMRLQPDTEWARCIGIFTLAKREVLNLMEQDPYQRFLRKPGVCKVIQSSQYAFAQGKTDKKRTFHTHRTPPTHTGPVPRRRLSPASDVKRPLSLRHDPKGGSASRSRINSGKPRWSSEASASTHTSGVSATRSVFGNDTKLHLLSRTPIHSRTPPPPPPRTLLPRRALSLPMLRSHHASVYVTGREQRQTGTSPPPRVAFQTHKEPPGNSQSRNSQGFRWSQSRLSSVPRFEYDGLGHTLDHHHHHHHHRHHHLMTISPPPRPPRDPTSPRRDRLKVMRRRRLSVEARFLTTVSQDKQRGAGITAHAGTEGKRSTETRLSTSAATTLAPNSGSDPHQHGHYLCHYLSQTRPANPLMTPQATSDSPSRMSNTSGSESTEGASAGIDSAGGALTSSRSNQSRVTRRSNAKPTNTRPTNARAPHFPSLLATLLPYNTKPTSQSLVSSLDRVSLPATTASRSGPSFSATFSATSDSLSAATRASLGIVTQQSANGVGMGSIGRISTPGVSVERTFPSGYARTPSQSLGTPSLRSSQSGGLIGRPQRESGLIDTVLAAES